MTEARAYKIAYVVLLLSLSQLIVCLRFSTHMHLLSFLTVQDTDMPHETLSEASDICFSIIDNVRNSGGSLEVRP